MFYNIHDKKTPFANSSIENLDNFGCGQLDGRQKSGQKTQRLGNNQNVKFVFS
jgi:hypothetical protein